MKLVTNDWGDLLIIAVLKIIVVKITVVEFEFSKFLKSDFCGSSFSNLNFYSKYLITIGLPVRDSKTLGFEWIIW